jgi:hypothetical protein
VLHADGGGGCGVSRCADVPRRCRARYDRASGSVFVNRLGDGRWFVVGGAVFFQPGDRCEDEGCACGKG